MIFSIFVQAAVLVTVFMIILNWVLLKSTKLQFASSRKIIKIIEEHNNILNKLPDGAMIHKTMSDIRKQQNKMVHLE